MCDDIRFGVVFALKIAGRGVALQVKLYFEGKDTRAKKSKIEEFGVVIESDQGCAQGERGVGLWREY